MIKGVLFDFDGLLVDTESAWYESYKETMRELHDADIDLLAYSACIGTNDSRIIAYFSSVLGFQVDFEVIETASLRKYEEKMKSPKLREGVLEYLEEARRLGLKIGLASSSTRKWVIGYLERLRILSYFDVIHTKDDVRNVKPDPELYTITLRDCGLQPHEAIAFEDSLNGLLAAKRAGIYCVIVPNPVTEYLPFELHDDRIPSMRENSIQELVARRVNRRELSQDRLQTALVESWSPQSGTKWTADNPAKGQCGVTALVVHDLWGGDLRKTNVPEGWHYYNKINGDRYDFTDSQFSHAIDYEDIPSNRAEALSDTNEAQYRYLSQKVQASLTVRG